jgi:small subunit ribosomal protein S14
MAKESMKAREVKRAKLVARYAEKRAALKKIIATAEDPMEAYEAARKLQSIPKNADPIRLHNRCKITGRPKGYIRQFGISRIQSAKWLLRVSFRCEESKLVKHPKSGNELMASGTASQLSSHSGKIFFNIVGVVPIN